MSRSLTSGNTKSCGCAKFKTKQLTDRLAQKGFQVIEAPKTTPTSSKWRLRCPQGHRISANVGNILSGSSGCTECSGYIGTYTESQIIEVLESKDRTLISYWRNDTNRVVVESKHEHCGEITTELLHHLRNKEKQRCSSCSKRGFRPEEPAHLYLHRLSPNEGDVFYKYGITNNQPKDRIEHQLKSFSGNSELLMTLYFPRGSECSTKESYIKKRIGSYVSKEVFPDGFTETFKEEDLNLFINMLFN
jgi:hypothetical protein